MGKVKDQLQLYAKFLQDNVCSTTLVLTEPDHKKALSAELKGETAGGGIRPRESRRREAEKREHFLTLSEKWRRESKIFSHLTRPKIVLAWRSLKTPWGVLRK